ncbi:MAG: hypothetical protein DWQ07_05865 [Chloroflexi bacterium]|nr:MAG: hypothetical protein DWQ07_05865 [Chloroflexota bacterium]MBL1196695.1 hypothetical protein [Chloroflexota bacterium]NOH13988.1 hypothetical protein [Chloroflexota bacterium]
MKKQILLIGASLILSACSALPGAAGISGCEAAGLVEDVTIDVPLDVGVPLMPGTHFTKAWKLENTGTCAWTEEFDLVFSDGDRLGSPDEVSLPKEVSPGQTVTLAVPLTAPDESGNYSGEWLLRNTQGESFGIGESPLTTDIVVAELPLNVAYDFLQAHCLAQWNTGLAIFLPCEGETGERIGWVQTLEDPALEDTRNGNPPVLSVSPDNQDDGFIQGVFPPVTVKEGQSFKARVGCLHDLVGCELVFQLNYEIVGEPERLTLAEWPESYDGDFTEIDLDVSGLAGETVRFILEVHANGGRTADAQGYWLNPRIEN